MHPGDSSRLKVQRVQTGVRIEKRMLQVLKGLAEYLDMSLGDLLEGVVLSAFEGEAPFTPATLKKVRQLKAVYEMDYDKRWSHRMTESDGDGGS